MKTNTVEIKNRKWEVYFESEFLDKRYYIHVKNIFKKKRYPIYHRIIHKSIFNYIPKIGEKINFSVEEIGGNSYEVWYLCANKYTLPNEPRLLSLEVVAIKEMFDYKIVGG